MHIRSLEKRTIVIIGAGYSGTLTAVNILRTNSRDDLQVLLIEKESIPARGLAYRFSDDNLLLNVPAGNMSALADEPNHFVSYCQDVDPAFNAKSFISRRLYGEYLEFTLREADTNSPGILVKLKAEVVAVLPDISNTTYRIELANGSYLKATQVVLALGHFPPSLPTSVPEQLHDDTINPWDFGALDGLDQNKPVAILGMGHTAIDACFRLTNWNSTRKIILLSRRGLLPHAHRFNPNPPISSDHLDCLVGISPTVRAYTRALRLEVIRRETAGGDWRDVINELRPHIPRLWQGLPETERRRFLKKIVPYWDIHRHRLAPSAARRLEKLLDSGQVERIAAHIIGVEMKGKNLNIQIKGYRNGHLGNLEVGALVNCTGPTYDLSVLSQPLVIQLRKSGLIKQDPLKLGLLVDDDYRVLDACNQPTPGFFYVGPMLKAQYWEAIAVPELRNHTHRLARVLMSIEN